MKQVPQKAPLPCYGLEHDRADPQCQACPHYAGCLEHMGSRADKVPLDRLRFDIIPKEFQKKIIHEAEDPEIPYLQRLYSDCFASIYHRNPADSASYYKSEIAANARRANCSVRMFILANMVAHEMHQKTMIEHTERQRAVPFRAKLLTNDLSVKRAETYQEMCNDRFGTFSLKSLEVLTDVDRDDIDAKMEHNETTAGLWVVRFRIYNGVQRDPTLTALYADKEFDLDPEWLALEPSYGALVLDAYRAKRTGTEALQRHRFNVIQSLGHYKKHPAMGRAAWLARQDALPRTVRVVVSRFGYQPEDFLYPREPITDMMNFWLELGLTIRHNHCWRLLEGETSFFGPRRNETLVRRS